MKKYLTALVVFGVFVLLSVAGLAKERVKLSPDTPKSQIIHMNPAEVDASLLPLDPIDNLNTTGVPPKDFDLSKWYLEVKGGSVGKELRLSYEELQKLPMVKKKVLLICPGFFADYAEWEGVPLREILKLAEVKDYRKILFVGLDNYRAQFSQDELEGERIDLLFLALRVNGETLPLEHGFPARLVAEDFYGGRWVKWIREVVVE
jgi:DMSO/TMAO reductase YedYZ molybdopterin-dependent catalytic subunit